MKNEENFVENLVAPAPKLFGNEIVRRRNGPQRNWQRRKWRRRKVVDASQLHQYSLLRNRPISETAIFNILYHGQILHSVSNGSLSLQLLS